MRVLINTMKSIDENSKRIVFKHFDQSTVNSLAKEAPGLINRINSVGVHMRKQEKTLTGDYEFNSDNIPSDSSGNHSENDELNILRKFQKKLGVDPRNVNILTPSPGGDLDDDPHMKQDVISSRN